MSHAEVRTIFFGLMLAAFLAALNQTIIATALPTIGRHFADFENLSWIVTAYLLTSTAVAPLYGKLSDIYGRRAMMQTGIGLFVAGSVLAAAAPDMMTLIVGPFADGYPISTGGFHFGGLVGLAYVGLGLPGGDDQDAVGFGGAFWAGHDVWVAPEWSVGGSLRLDALRATTSDPDATVTEVGLTLSFSVLYN